MAHSIAPVLDESNSQLYKPRQDNFKHALLHWAPAEYQLEWGTQNFDGPHMRLEANGKAYGCELKAFFDTHLPVKAREHHYLKTGTVRALLVSEPTDLKTVVADRVEAIVTVEPGGYVVQNPGGEQYSNTREEFERLYEPA